MQINAVNDFTTYENVYGPLSQADINSFLADEKTAIQMLDAAFSNNITVTIDVGYGSYNGQILNSQNTSEGDTNGGWRLSYSVLKADLEADGEPGFFNSVNLPGNPGATNFWVSTSVGQIFGIADNQQVDGYVGIGTGFTPGAQRVDAFLHEIGHALARVPENQYAGYYTYYSELDLWRFTDVQTRLFDGTNPDYTFSYFSIDGGNTEICQWGQTSDSSDFRNGYPFTNDPFNESVVGLGHLTNADITCMEALGFTASPAVWNQIDGGSPVAMTAGDFEGLGSAQLAAVYSGYGVYLYNGGWAKIDGGSPTMLAEGNLYGTTNGNNNNADIAAFYQGYGTYVWENGDGWTHIDSGAVSVMTTGAFTGGSVDEIAAVFNGYGVYTWSANSGWNKIDAGSPTMLAAGDIYGATNGNSNDADLVAYYQGYGTYVWGANTGWNRIDTGAPTEYATGNFLGTADGNNNQADIAAYFPNYGTYIWSAAGGGWQKIDSGHNAGMASVDLSGNGQNELLAYFQNYGVYEWQNGAGWTKYDNTSALPTSAQQALFATGNFQGGPVVDAAVTFSGQGGVWLDPPPGASDAGAGQNATLGYAANADNFSAITDSARGTSVPNMALLGQAIASAFPPPSASSSAPLFSAGDLINNQSMLLTHTHPSG